MIKAALIGLSCLVPGVGTACSIAFDEVCDAERKAAIRENRPVATGRRCAFVNAGVPDIISGGPAIALEADRFYQHVWYARPFLDGPPDGPAALQVDCGAHDVTMIRATYKKPYTFEDSCYGPGSEEFNDFLQPNGPLTLLEGASLADFERIAEETDEIDVYPRLGDLHYEGIPAKERVDFMCGCRLHYPNSNGAKQ